MLNITTIIGFKRTKLTKITKCKRIYYAFAVDKSCFGGKVQHIVFHFFSYGAPYHWKMIKSPHCPTKLYKNLFL